MVEAICAINASLATADSMATLQSLKNPSAGIRSITDDCAEAYLEKLVAAKQYKIDTGE